MTRHDTFRGIRREWRNGRVWTGLVSVPGKRGYSYYEVRQNGQTIKHVSGLSKVTLALAREVAQQIQIPVTTPAETRLVQSV